MIGYQNSLLLLVHLCVLIFFGGQGGGEEGSDRVVFAGYQGKGLVNEAFFSFFS